MAKVCDDLYFSNLSGYRLKLFTHIHNHTHMHIYIYVISAKKCYLFINGAYFITSNDIF